MKYIDDASLDCSDKRVLVRAGFDVALTQLPTVGDQPAAVYEAAEARRIEAGCETIRFLLGKGARVIIINQVGRPGGKIVPALSNAPVAKKLGELLGEEIPLFSLDAQYKIQDTRYNVVMLENVRFNPGEENNDAEFARELAKLGDIYVNDAFSNSHRAHASMVGLPRLLPSYGGLLLKKELVHLLEAKDNPFHPLLLIIGGAKIGTKLKVLRFFWDKSEGIMLGGAIANTLLHASGIAVGKSLIEEDELAGVADLPLTDTRLHLPVDVRVARDFEGASGPRIAPVGRLEEEEIILDIGPDSEELFDNIIQSAKMVIWNGPIGKFEIPAFAHGTLAIAESIKASKAKTIIGGGETIEFLARHNLLDAFSFVSTGGGAMLEYLGGEKLPALEALEDVSQM